MTRTTQTATLIWRMTSHPYASDGCVPVITGWSAEYRRGGATPPAADGAVAPPTPSRPCSCGGCGERVTTGWSGRCRQRWRVPLGRRTARTGAPPPLPAASMSSSTGRLRGAPTGISCRRFGRPRRRRCHGCGGIQVRPRHRRPRRQLRWQRRRRRRAGQRQQPVSAVSGGATAVGGGVCMRQQPLEPVGVPPRLGFNLSPTSGLHRPCQGCGDALVAAGRGTPVAELVPACSARLGAAPPPPLSATLRRRAATMTVAPGTKTRRRRKMRRMSRSRERKRRMARAAHRPCLLTA